MKELLTAREICVRFYKRYEVIFMFAFKFIAALYIFSLLKGIGNYRGEFNVLFESSLAIPFMLLMSILFAISPPTLANALVVLFLLLQTSASAIPTVYIGLLLVLVLVLYCRLSPERSFLILAVIIGYRFNMPYIPVLFAGLYYGVTSIVPITIGVLINSFIPFFANILTTVQDPEKLDVMQLPSLFLDTYKSVFEAFTSDFGWIFTAFVFAIVVIAVYSISRLFTDYCAEIAIAVGAFVNIVGFICASSFIKADTGVFGVIVFTVLSAAIVEFLHFFDIVLDYERQERVQFEDEENYYYVKIVPKLMFLPAEGEETGHVKTAGAVRPGKGRSAFDLKALLGLSPQPKAPARPATKFEDDDTDDDMKEERLPLRKAAERPSLPPLKFDKESEDEE